MENIWVAAGDGDLDRVKHCIEIDRIDPNIHDQFSYTPMHAAASYGRIDVLAYLLSRGADVNITDADGDTPLYTVEDVDTARFLVDSGANINITNNDGISPIDHLQDDFPHIAAFLESARHAEMPNVESMR